MSESRYRNFATIVYLESAKECWLDILNDLHVKSLVSPIHDRDTNSDGTPKKPHYHVLIMFDGKKSKAQAQVLFSSFGGVGCEVIQSAKAYARYLIHKDNPDKAQYSESDVKVFGGANYSEISKNEKDEISDLREVLIFIRDFGFTNLCDLVDTLVDEGMLDTLRFVRDNTYFINEYIKSSSYTKQKGR